MNLNTYRKSFFVLAILLITAAFAGCAASEVTDIANDTDELRISVNELSEKPAYYAAKIDGTPIEVIALIASDGSVRAAFNTCQICYSSGKGYYKTDGNELVCQNCGNRFGFDEVGLEDGGCNPVPITDKHYSIEDDTLVIDGAFLKNMSSIFENWKS